MQTRHLLILNGGRMCLSKYVGHGKHIHERCLPKTKEINTESIKYRRFRPKISSYLSSDF